jgi:hypothetical protein
MVKSKNKIKKKSPSVGEISTERKNLVFSFSELQDISYTNAKEDAKFFIAFMKQLRDFCNLTWSAVDSSPRHSKGNEKIPKNIMTEAASHLLPAGMDSLRAMRANGDNRVFLGYRERDVFKIIFIESTFGDIYEHGKKK